MSKCKNISKSPYIALKSKKSQNKLNKAKLNF